MRAGSINALKSILFVAFHFPPMTHSSGVQRSLRFVRYLRDEGWEARVLSAQRRAYVSVGDEQLPEIPEGMVVERAFALDAARHLSIAGRYPALFATPDRWASWRIFSIRLGRKMIRQHRPAAIFSTYPIATTHEIAFELARWSGLPWVADFRDSLFDANYPADRRQRAIHQEIDAKTVNSCSRAIFTTRSTRQMYRERYPNLPADHWSVIPNGYEESDFEGLGTIGTLSQERRVTQRLLLHAGVLYPLERDPLPFFRAIRDLKTRGVIDSTSLLIRLRGTAHDLHYAPILRQMDLEDIIELATPLPYRQALKEMTEADGLLLFQASSCNHQVPAKLYEYLRARRPIIALTDEYGDTAAVLREASADNLLPLNDQAIVTRELPILLDRLDRGELSLAPTTLIEPYSRAQGAKQLSEILQAVTESSPDLSN